MAERVNPKPLTYLEANAALNAAWWRLWAEVCRSVRATELAARCDAIAATRDEARWRLRRRATGEDG